MRYLCFGGTFNPIHHGHLLCARAAAEELGFSRILLIPAGHPPHKFLGADSAPAAHRLAMCRLAAELEPDLFEVDPLEIDRPQPSYTIETVRQLKQTRGWTRVDWLLGADMLLDLPRWRDPEALLRETNFIILRRPGWEIDWHTLPAKFLPLRSNVVDGPMITISASDIRRRVQVGRSVQYLVPPAVAAYIKEHGLYR